LIKVSFASTRPDGSYALAIPVWGEDALGDRLTSLDEAGRSLAARAAAAQRFERETATVAETFYAEGETARRLLLVGLGGNRNDEAYLEKAGGALTARLLCSGEARLVIDLSGLSLDSEAAARIGFGAAARAWRYDLYRTKLGKNARPTLEEIVIVGGGDGADAAWTRKSALLEGISFARELVTEPANVIFPVSFVERCREQMEPLGVEFEVLDEKQMGELGMGALLGVSLGSAQPRASWQCAGTAAPIKTPSRSC
jgi:leucyl aminopeptidase